MWDEVKGVIGTFAPTIATALGGPLAGGAVKVLTGALGDQTPAILGYVIVAGFFGILAAMIFVDLPSGSGDILKVLLGSLGAMTVQVGNFFFGSSRGSRIKDAMIPKS